MERFSKFFEAGWVSDFGRMEQDPLPDLQAAYAIFVRFVKAVIKGKKCASM